MAVSGKLACTAHPVLQEQGIDCCQDNLTKPDYIAFLKKCCRENKQPSKCQILSWISKEKPGIENRK